MGLLRLLLAVSVVFAHSPWRDGYALVGGRCAVQVFYMISGFLMSHILVTENRYPGVARFYLSRWLRICPLYYVVAVLALVFALLHRHGFFHLYRDLPLAAALPLALSNITIFGQDWAMFAGVTDGHLTFASDFQHSDLPLYRGLLLPQAWTLGLELTFYLIAPFVLRRRKMIWTLLAASIAVRGLLFYLGVGQQDPWTYRFFPAELFFFLVGALSNQLLLPLWKSFLARAGNQRTPALATFALAGFVAIYFLIPVGEGVKEPVLFIAAALLLPLLFIYQDGSRFDRRIGELSYPVYIGHILAVQIAAPLTGRLTMHNALAVSLGNVVCAIVFAVALDKAIGHSMETFRKKTMHDVRHPSDKKMGSVGP